MQFSKRAGLTPSPRSQSQKIMRFIFPLFILWISGICSVMAADPVQVLVEGVGGEELKNVRAALTLPTGILRDGTVDRQLLEIFQRQIPEKVKKALEPFGYYDVQVSSAMEKIEKDEALIRVKVIPGEPIQVAAVNVRITGPGEQNPGLKQLSLLQRFLDFKPGEPYSDSKIHQTGQSIFAFAKRSSLCYK